METIIRYAVLYAVAALAASSPLYAQSIDDTLAQYQRFVKPQEPVRGGGPTVVAPQDAGPAVGEHDAAEAPTAVSDNRPVVFMYSPTDGSCSVCRAWKAKGDDDLPFRLVFREQDEFPVDATSYPVFQYAGAEDASWYEWGYTREQLVAEWEKKSAAARGAVSSVSAADDAAQSPTPHSQVAITLAGMNLTPNDVLLDPGCGDARALIMAVRDGMVRRAIGVEIDPDQAELARQRVSEAGLSDRIEIREGDSTKMDLSEATAAFCYLYPQTLEALKPQLIRMKVGSYLHRIPMLGGQVKRGKSWYWEPSQQQTVSTQAAVATQPNQQQQPSTSNHGRPYAIYQNMKFYGPCCNDGSCTMRQNIVWQLANRVHVEPAPQQAVRYCRSCGR